MKKCGFTLAEVLITLAVIGVVAALTIPTVVRNYQKTQAVTQLKKAYSALANTTNLAIADEGPIATWDLSGEYGAMSVEFADRYLIPYLKVSKNCGVQTSGGCEFQKIPMNYNTQYNYSFSDKLARFYLADGTFIALVTNTSDPPRQYVEIWVDINGQKKPNICGKDIFRFEYWIKGNGVKYDGKFLPHGFENSRETLMSGSGTSEGCNKNSLGFFCSALIMKDGWQMKDDYPWN